MKYVRPHRPGRSRMTQSWPLILAVLSVLEAAASAQAQDAVPPRAAQSKAGSVGSEGLTLAAAARLAVMKSPRLSSYSWDIRAAEAAGIQASVRPNPQLALEVEDVLGTGEFEGAREAQTTLSFSQLMELGNKRARRTAAAAALTDSARKEYDLKKNDLLADLASTFIDVLEAQAEQVLAADAIALARENLGTAIKRSEAGKGSLLEVRKVEVTIEQAELVEEHAAHELAAKRALLASFWRGDVSDLKPATGDLYAVASLPPRGELEANLTNNPDVQRVAVERSARQASLRLEESRSIPDVSVGAGVRRLEGPDDTAFLVSFSTPLTIFDRNTGRRQEVEALVRKSEDEAKEAKARASALLFALYQEFSHMKLELKVIDERIAPKSEEALSLARAGYDAGRFGYLELMDAARTLLEVKRRRIEVAANQHKLAIEVERLIGLAQYKEE